MCTFLAGYHTYFCPQNNLNIKKQNKDLEFTFLFVFPEFENIHCVLEGLR